MSESLLTALRAIPTAKIRAMPELTDDIDKWLLRFFGRDEFGRQKVTVDQEKQGVAVLRLDEPFFDSVCAFANDMSFEATFWDPRGEGYDDGPGDMSDNWRAGSRLSTGCFEGWDVNEHPSVFDELSACVAVALADCDWTYDNQSKIEAREQFAAMLKEEWEGPRSQEERDKAIAAEILRLAKGLSRDARQALVGRLSAH